MSAKMELNIPQAKWLSRVVLFAIILFAFLLITTTIDFQSFWIDEVHAFYFIDRPFSETVDLLINPENNGPLYFVLLWVWNRLAGPSDFSIRFLSDLCMILTIVLLWKLTRAWFNERTANIAACIMALGPFTIWFGQEAKMYALHMMLAIASTLLLTLALRYGKWYRWLAYGIAINLLGYSHFFGALTIGAQGILVILTSLKCWKTIRSYLVTMTIIAIPYIPVVLYALRLAPSYEGQDNSKGFVEFPHVIQELVSEYTLRVPRIYVSFITPLVIVSCSLLSAGLMYALLRKRSRGTPNYGIWLSGLIILPVLVYYVGSFVIPVFSARYLSAIYPMCVIAIAMLVSAARKIAKPVGTALFACILLFVIWGNFRIFTQPALQRSDWRLVANYIDTHAGPNDIIVGFADYVPRALLRYYDGNSPVLRFKAEPYAPEAFFLDQQSLGYDHMWLVLHQDQAMAPGNTLQQSAGTLYPVNTGIYPNAGNIAVLNYSMRWELPELPISAHPLDNGQFKNGVLLAGFEVDTKALQPDDQLLHPPSNWIHVITYWQRTGEVINDNFTPFIHLIDADGGVWGAELQRAPTVWHRTPATGWQATSTFEIHYDVNLNPDTPPGVYVLVAGLSLNDELRTPIPTTAQTSEVILTDIQITD